MSSNADFVAGAQEGTLRDLRDRLAPAGSSYLADIRGGTRRGSVATAPATVTIPTTAAEIVAANADRVCVSIYNPSSTQDIRLGYGANPTTANGMVVRPFQTWTEDRYTGAIHAITTPSTIAAPFVEVD